MQPLAENGAILTTRRHHVQPQRLQIASVRIYLSPRSVSPLARLNPMRSALSAEPQLRERQHPLGVQLPQPDPAFVGFQSPIRPLPFEQLADCQTEFIDAQPRVVGDNLSNQPHLLFVKYTPNALLYPVHPDAPRI